MELNLHAGWIQFWVSVFIFVGSGLLAVLKVGYDLAKHEEKLDKKIVELTTKVKSEVAEDLNNAVENGDKKRARIYERFDEYKNFVENTFVRREMCGMMHQSTSGEIGGLRGEINGIKNDLNKLSEKLDAVKNLIINLNKEG